MSNSMSFPEKFDKNKETKNNKWVKSHSFESVQLFFQLHSVFWEFMTVSLFWGKQHSRLENLKHGMQIKGCKFSFILLNSFNSGNVSKNNEKREMKMRVSVWSSKKKEVEEQMQQLNG